MRQAMPQGGTLRATLAKNSNDRLRIAFTDTGQGMSPDQVEHLFEPFSSTTGGTGLGLSIVYQIIRDHGGTINVAVVRLRDNDNCRTANDDEWRRRTRHRRRCD